MKPLSHRLRGTPIAEFLQFPRNSTGNLYTPDRQDLVNRPVTDDLPHQRLIHIPEGPYGITYLRQEFEGSAILN